MRVPARPPQPALYAGRRSPSATPAPQPRSPVTSLVPTPSSGAWRLARRRRSATGSPSRAKREAGGVAQPPGRGAGLQRGPGGAGRGGVRQVAAAARAVGRGPHGQVRVPDARAPQHPRERPPRGLDPARAPLQLDHQLALRAVARAHERVLDRPPHVRPQTPAALEQRDRGRDLADAPHPERPRRRAAAGGGDDAPAAGDGDLRAAAVAPVDVAHERAQVRGRGERRRWRASARGAAPTPAARLAGRRPPRDASPGRTRRRPRPRRAAASTAIASSERTNMASVKRGRFRSCTSRCHGCGSRPNESDALVAAFPRARAARRRRRRLRRPAGLALGP